MICKRCALAADLYQEQAKHPPASENPSEWRRICFKRAGELHEECIGCDCAHRVTEQTPVRLSA